MKENVNPNSLQEDSYKKNPNAKPILVNLIRSLANLSVQSVNVVQEREKAEVTSKNVSPTKCNLLLKSTSQVPEHLAAIEGAQNEFVFGSSKDVSSAKELRKTRPISAIRRDVLKPLMLKRERAPPHNRHPVTHDYADVELSGYGESPDGSQHKKDL
ncbi:hypothetical protein PIB30_069713 [Stylosanthes scabra]|uniref:Uncharacterized protein n=1 Tax=Stylosanthes scabra TaxID=79078 RepID=A0ABU6UP97_9FABA|nr:hypothetical protein [Stylosanthes scabra]